jgi:hypothetical protein
MRLISAASHRLSVQIIAFIELQKREGEHEYHQRRAALANLTLSGFNSRLFK